MKRREYLTLDMTPIIDIVFLLLIFFLVTAVFKKDELALILNLPSSKEGVKVVDKKELVIELTQSKIAINKNILTFKEIEATLSKIEDRELPILIRIDKDVKYERIIKLFDLLKRVKLQNIQLITNAS